MKFNEAITKIEFVVNQNLFVVKEDSDNPYIRLALEDAKKHNADAVYFRFFSGNRPPQPQAYIYDYISRKEFNEEFSKIYKNLWLSGRVPLIYVFTDSEIKIFNAYKKPDYDAQNDRFNLTTIVEIAYESQKKINEYSAKKLDNGTFWDSEKQKNDFDFNTSSYKTLLYHLKKTLDDMINSEDQLPKNEAKVFYQNLLLRSILIKYLEEREDENRNTIFPAGFFKDFSQGDDTFVSVLKRQGAIVELFQVLEGKFNGGVFELLDIEVDMFLKIDLSHFADLFNGYIDKKEQLNIWRLYSFNYLPIELISNIYEEFLESEKGVVYTPPFLVDFLIDQCIPLNNGEFKLKVLDPACGSGVFLVAAYKRLVQRWRFKNGWNKPDIKILKEILKRSIFGIDIKGKDNKKTASNKKYLDATKLAAFSLNIALCDQLSPKTIWKELDFEDLTKENLLTEDFFQVVSSGIFNNKFDLVIGNPPFVKNLTTQAAIDIEKVMVGKRGIKLPNRQLALLFLEQSISLSKDKALICMIQPAGPFLYNSHSFNFRKRLFENNYFKLIFDLTSLQSTLFEKANVATVVVILNNTLPLQRDTYHITVRRTKSTNEKLFFELDKYDFHKVKYNDAIENKLIWKSNLLGGGRLNQIANKFSEIRNLGEFIEDKVKNFNWVIGIGFEVLTYELKKEFLNLKNKYYSLSDKERAKLHKLEIKYTAEFLTGEKTIPSEPKEIFWSNGIENNCLEVLQEKYFSRKRVKEIYTPPHLIIRKVAAENGIPVEFRDDNLSFTNQFIGIHSNENDSNELKEIEKRIKNSRFCIFTAYLYSPRALISKSTSLLKEDILAIPYPEDEKILKLTSIEEILVDDVLNYQLEFHRKGEDSIILNKVSEDELMNFGAVFCRVLNSIYKSFKPYSPYSTSSFVCYPFYFGDEPEVNIAEYFSEEDKFEKHINSLIRNEIHQNLRIIRTLRIYEKNVIYLIKPNQLRYWLRSIAIRDADDTYADLVAQGY